MELLWIGREKNVSGGADLANRPELSKAIAAIEAGEAEVIVVAYFDRFFRSLRVQHEVVARVEAAGGELLALDHGKLTNGSAAQRLNANMMGAVAQFYRDQGREKSMAGQARAVARGALPWARVPWGYQRRSDGTVEPVPDLVPHVQEVFERRAAGDSITKIRKYLREHEIDRTARGVQQMLSQRLYIGELHFKDLTNLNACEPIVDRELFNRVQKMIIPRGPQPKADRLLSRLKVLRCGGCGTPLGTMKLPQQGNLTIYRCASTNMDCPNHVTINADPTETWVWDRVKERLDGVEGSAAAEDAHRRLTSARDAAQTALDRAVKGFAAAGVNDEASSVAELRSLREVRDAAQAELEDLPPGPTALVVKADDSLPQDVRRAIIQATVRAVTVAPARGTGLRGVDRLSIDFF